MSPNRRQGSKHNKEEGVPVHAQVLAELQDRLQSFPSAIAMQLIEEELGQPVGAIYAQLSPEPVAAASLGQARPNSGSGSTLAHHAALACHSVPSTLQAQQCSGVSRFVRWCLQVPHACRHRNSVQQVAICQWAAQLEACRAMQVSCAKMLADAMAPGVSRAPRQHGRGSRGEGAAPRHRREHCDRHGAAAAPDDRL